MAEPTKSLGFKLVAQEPQGLPQGQPTEKPGLLSGLLNKSKKWYYSILSNYSKAESMGLQGPQDCISFAGSRFSVQPVPGESPEMLKGRLQAENSRLQAEIASTLWFSYRQGWKRCLLGTKLDGDVGWGCMIRCGQMMLAKTVQKAQQTRSEHINRQFIDLCRDEAPPEVAPFSLFGLVEYAKKTFAVEPGQWFRATTIMMSLDHMNVTHSPALTSPLVIVTSVDSLIEPSSLYSRVFPSQASAAPKTALDCFTALRTQQWEKQALLCVAMRIGLNKPQANFKAALAELICLPQTVGFLGGRDSKAYFVLGYNRRKEKYYYLDPHYVQDADNQGKGGLESYKPLSLYEYNYEEMVTSLMIAFYLKSKEDFEALFLMVQALGEDNLPFNFSRDTMEGTAILYGDM